MSDKSSEELSTLASKIDDALALFKEHNKHARKRNRLAKKQYQQSVLNHEQVERQYLIEKSRLQPSFRLSATEFLMCEPDFVNDPEQASEAKFVSGFGIELDERVLRIKLHVKGDAEYMRPNLVIPRSNEQQGDEHAYAMSELIYFVDVDSVQVSKAGSLDVYLVYQDKTTLPVIHKYQLVQRNDSTLPRWDASHVDTVYAASHKNVLSYKNSAGCEALFADREKS